MSKKTKKSEESNEELKFFAILAGLILVVGTGLYQFTNDDSAYNLISSHNVLTAKQRFRAKINDTLGFKYTYRTAGKQIKRNAEVIEELRKELYELMRQHPKKEKGCK